MTEQAQDFDTKGEGTVASGSGSRVDRAKEKLADVSQAARAKAHDAAEAARVKAHEAAGRARTLKAEAGTRGADLIQTSPLAVAATGLAAGALIGALLPTTNRERQALGKVGSGLRSRAQQATAAAKNAGGDALSRSGLDAGSLKAQARSLLGQAGDALKAAGSAAAEGARKRD